MALSEGRVYGRTGGRTLNDALAERVVERPEMPFLIFEATDGAVREWTYREFDARCEALAGGLAELGITAGNKVILRMATRAAADRLLRAAPGPLQGAQRRTAVRRAAANGGRQGR